MINKDIIAKIILDFQNKDLPNLVERDLKIDLNIPLKRAIAIIGPRRSGKTYYFYCLIQQLLNKQINKQRILYINFEDPKLTGADLEDLSAILDIFYEIYPENKQQKAWLFFDEIQNIKNWEIFIRNILDSEQAGVFVSGSSSKLLSKEIATSLRGRSLSYLILPFNFAEFLKLKNFVPKKYLSSAEQAKLKNLFKYYFSCGGYPEALLYPKEQKRIIDEIIEVMIYRDLIERHNIRNTKALKLMFNALIRAKEFSLHKFFNFLKSLNIKISKNSLYNYLEYFNDAFIFFPLRKFSFSLKKSEQSLAKIYVIDNAFITYIIGDDKGKKLENLCFLGLLSKNFEPNKDFFYYVLNHVVEIDFIIKQKNSIKQLIQVCYDIDDYNTRQREIKSLIKASTELKCNNLLIITYDYEAEERVNGKKIKYISLWRWLLDY